VCRFDQLLCADRLSFSGRGIICHALALRHGNGCLLAAGCSGKGKSTLARLLRTAVGVATLSDERVILFDDVSAFHVQGTPWQSAAREARPESGPVRNLLFLRHADTNHLSPLRPAQAATELFRCTFPPFWHTPGMGFALEFCIRIAKKIPCYEFGFRPDMSAVGFLLKELELC